MILHGPFFLAVLVAANSFGLEEGIDRLRTHLREGRASEAETGARSLLGEAESRYGPESTEAARVLDVLVEALWRGGKAAEPGTRELAQRSVDVRRRLLGDRHPDTASSLHYLGNVLSAIRDDPAAESAYLEALSIREESLGPEHPDVAKTLNNLGVIAARRGDHAGARSLHERSLTIREKRLGPEHLDLDSSLSNLALLHTASGDYEAAIRLIERTVHNHEKALGPDHPALAHRLDHLGNLRLVAGDYARAAEPLERALEIQEKALGAEHPDLVETLIGLTKLRNMAGDFDGARPFHARALAIWSKEAQTDDARTAWRLTRLANILYMTGDLAGARPLYERALSICEKSMGPRTEETASTLNNLAALLLEEGHPETAKGMFERALEIRKAVLPAGDPAIAESLSDLGTTLRVLGEHASARPLIEESLRMRESSYGPNHPRTVESQVQLAKLLVDMGRVQEALEEALRAEERGRRHLTLALRALPERQALRYSLVRISGTELALSLAVKGLDTRSLTRVWEAVIRSRAIVLDEMAARRRIAREQATASDPLLEDLTAARKRFANLSVQLWGDIQGEAYPAVLLRAREEMERAERAAAEHARRPGSSSARGDLGLAQIASRLDSKSALIAYVVYEHHDCPVKARAGAPAGGTSPMFPGAARKGDKITRRYLAFILRGGSIAPRVVQLGGATGIERSIARWSSAMPGPVSMPRPDAATAEAETRRHGLAVRSLLWDPLRQHLSGVEKVFVVPDGAVHLVNLGALPIGKSAYLVENGPLFHTLSAERDLVLPGGGSAAGSGLLAVGGPAFDTGKMRDAERRPALRRHEDGSLLAGHDLPPSCKGFADTTFEPLPGSVLEVEQVARLWLRRNSSNPETGSDVLLLTAEEANEAAFKKNAAGRRIVHLATHGFVLGDACPSTFGLLRGVGALVLPRVDDFPSPLPGSNPLSLSGLALAGANERTSHEADEDGILTADEIAALDLSSVEWVVLSACSTGVGEVQAGEGVLGLRRAFQEAGARSLIMSLWPVGDEPTRAWMQALYEARLTLRKSTAASMRHASLSILRARRAAGLSTHPFYWGAFIASGDWR